MHVAITGASSGIGEALAREYLARGDRVTLIARRAERLHALASDEGDRVHVVVQDLSDVDRACDWIASAEAALGPIDVLVNNAGASVVHPTVDTQWAAAETVMKLNALTPFKLTCAIAPKMVARRAGCIVDIASLAAFAQQPGFFFYNASKAALAAASESLRPELREANVHVLTVYPGPVRTPMADANFAVFDSTVARHVPTGDARTLARLIIRGVERRKPRIIYPRVYALCGWLPGLARLTVHLAAPELKNPRPVPDFNSK